MYHALELDVRLNKINCIFVCLYICSSSINVIHRKSVIPFILFLSFFQLCFYHVHTLTFSPNMIVAETTHRASSGHSHLEECRSSKGPLPLPLLPLCLGVGFTVVFLYWFQYFVNYIFLLIAKLYFRNTNL